MTLPNDEASVRHRAAIRVDYEANATIVAAVAQTHNVRPDQIYDMARLEGWTLRRNSAPPVNRAFIIGRLFRLLDRQIFLMEETMKTAGDKEVAVLGNLARTLEKLIAIEDAEAPKRVTKAHSKDMQDVRRQLQKRINDLTKG